jgi:hypothetical protein
MMVLRTKATMVRRHRDQEVPISDNDDVEGRHLLVRVQVDEVAADGERKFGLREVAAPDGCYSQTLLSTQELVDSLLLLVLQSR